MPETVNITRPALGWLIADIFAAAGASTENAGVAAAHIADANLCGVDTHGAWQVPGYVADMREGLIDAAAAPEVVHDAEGAVLISGRWTFGQVAAQFAVARGLEELQRRAVALVGVVQCHHLGRVGHYAELAADSGAIALVCGGGYGVGTPATVPFGGRDKVFNTNPLAMGFPAAQGDRMLSDFATTAGANARVRIAAELDQQLPPGWLVDAEGKPTTDPHAVAAGASLVPFGGHKGYALMTGIELLTRALTGADQRVEAGRGGPVYGHQGVTMILIRTSAFVPRQRYERTAADLFDQLRATAPAPGVEQVMIPGDPERRTRAERTAHGIPLAADVWERLTATAAELGVEVQR